MIRTPPQHQVDPSKAPGQIRTLNDYIKQKQQAYMTSDEAFDAWCRTEFSNFIDRYDLCKSAWDAAIEWSKKK